jgi:hypothetical protein
MFTLLVIGYIIYAILTIPYSIWISKQPGGTGLAVLSFIGQIFAYITLFLYLSSIGHTSVGLVLLLPGLTGLVVGIVLGIAEVL